MQVIVKFHEEADRLLIVCQGKVHIEFDHPEIHPAARGRSYPSVTN